MEVDEQYKYIIGLVQGEELLPFMAPEAGHQNTYKKVEIRINEDDGDEFIPISKEDPLNKRFLEPYRENTKRYAEVSEKYSLLNIRHMRMYVWALPAVKSTILCF